MKRILAERVRRVKVKPLSSVTYETFDAAREAEHGGLVKSRVTKPRGANVQIQALAEQRQQHLDDAGLVIPRPSNGVHESRSSRAVPSIDSRQTIARGSEHIGETCVIDRVGSRHEHRHSLVIRGVVV